MPSSRSNPFELGPQELIQDSTIDSSYRQHIIETALLESNRDGIGRSLFSVQKLIKFKLLIVVLLVGMVSLSGRVFALQIQHGPDYRSIAEENRIRIHVTKANRGMMTDKNQTWLARNLPSFQLEATPADLPQDPVERAALLKKVSERLGQDLPELSMVFESTSLTLTSFEPVVLSDQIDYTKALQIEIESVDWPGIRLIQSSTREYQPLASLSHVLGYISKISPEELKNDQTDQYLLTDRTGKSGLEATYEEALKGVDGMKRVEVNSLGKELKVIAAEEPEHGLNLTLTLDLELQRVAETSLQATLDRVGATGGAVVALDPRNGQVLALVSLPGFDANQFVKGLSVEQYQTLSQDNRNPLFSRAISGEYPSGSTIKPVIAAAALAEGIVTPKTSFLSQGGIRIGQWFFPDWKPGGHGQTNLRKAIAESVNTYFYLIGGGDENFTGLGVDRINTYAKRFGLSAPLGIDLPHEASGFLPTKTWKEEKKGERWYIGDTYHLAIGQGDVLVTPLQVASFTATIANGGAVYRPQLVLKKTNVFGEEVEGFNPTIISQQVVAPAHIQAIQEGLREAVLSGSARRLLTLPVTAAGKTGTAEFGESKATHAWFTSYAPYETPEIVVTALVEKGGGGHEAALPVALDVLAAYFKEKTPEVSFVE